MRNSGVRRIERERRPHGIELAEPVVEDRAIGYLEKSLLRRHEPVTRRDPGTRIEAEPVLG
jgi:hypothetical protein